MDTDLHLGKGRFPLAEEKECWPKSVFITQVMPHSPAGYTHSHLTALIS